MTVSPVYADKTRAIICYFNALFNKKQYPTQLDAADFS